jgi:hypothetical protein
VSAKISYELLVEVLENNKGVQLAIGPGDFYAANGGYPWRVERKARNRMWMVDGKVVRLEVSQGVIDGIFGPPRPMIL